LHRPSPVSARSRASIQVRDASGIPTIAVRENTTVLEMTNQAVQMANVIEVNSYLEAAGAILALRKGISLDSLRRPICGARRLVPA
jgi:hypothetical protein